MGVTNFDIIQANQYLGLPDTSGGTSADSTNTGAVFYVNNSTTGLLTGAISGSNGNSGTSPLTPFATLDFAIGRCTANRGDTIYILPGHAENIIAAGGVDADVAGIEIIGVGNSATRPAFTFTTVVGADLDVDAADITFKNITFDSSSLDAVTMPIDINSAGTKFVDCEFIFADAGAQSAGVITTGSNETRVYNCVFRGTTDTGCNQAIEITGTPSGIEIIGNTIYGDFANAPIYSTTAFTNAKINGNYCRNFQAAQFGIEFTAAATGECSHNRIVTNAVGTALDPGSLACFENKWQDSDDTDVSGILIPAAVTEITDSATNILGADSANNDFASTNVADNRDGSIIERTETIVATLRDDVASNFIGVDNANNTAATTNVADNRDGSLLERSESIIATLRDDVASNFIGVDNANNTAATTNVVANEDGSILERLERVQQATSRGTGTALAANESLADVLYAANGIATFPAAAAPANGISIAEVEREIYDQAEKSFTNTTGALVNATTIFTIAGGPIEILSLVARCVTGNDATASTLQWSADPTDGAAATFSAASASLAALSAGAMVVLQGTTLATAPIVNTTGVGLGQQVTNGIVVGAGIITTTIGVGSTTGTWQHHLRYRPLSRGVTVS